jgi:LysR family transcriptional regulator, hydrogen peroxide-inducible genes activator
MTCSSKCLDACHLEGLKNEEIRATSLETLRQMVGMGLGVTLIPVLAGGAPKPTRKQVVLKPLAPPAASRVIGLVWRRRSAVAQTMARLAETLAVHLPPETQAAD